jgi:beta-glucanase (GH16 family)
MRILRVVVVTCMLVLALVGTAGAEAASPRTPAPPPTPTATPAATSKATAAATATPAPTTDACGTLLKKADGSSWQCTFADDFTGTALDRTKWIPQTDFSHGTDTARSCFMDDPANVSVAGGNLRLSVRKLAKPVNCAGKPAGYAGGSVSTFYRFSQQYGRFEARMKVPATTQRGLHEAFWMWPDVRVPSAAIWPAAGEIDISESYSYYPDLSIPFLHYTYYDNWGSIPGLNTAWNCAASRGVWNTYTLEWSASRLEILVNGKTCLVNTSGDPAFRKPYIMAVTQGLGSTANGYTGTIPLPATTEVDYVKAWR